MYNARHKKVQKQGLICVFVNTSIGILQYPGLSNRKRSSRLNYKWKLHKIFFFWQHNYPNRKISLWHYPYSLKVYFYAPNQLQQGWNLSVIS